MLGGPAHGLYADGGGYPDLRVGLLVGAHPGVDVAVVVVLALPAEGAGIGPRLDNEVVGFLESFAVEDGRGVVGYALASAAAHEA